MTPLLYPLVRIRNIFFEPEGCPILAYHNITESGMIGKRWLNVSSKSFMKQMAYLYHNHYHVIKLEDFVRFMNKEDSIPKKSVVITFDDGYKNIYRIAYPILKEHDFPATLFLTSAFIGKKAIFPWLESNRDVSQRIRENESEWLPLSWREVKEMSTNGISIGSHTMTHPRLGALDEKEMAWEIRESKNMIERKIGKRVSLFAYPFSLLHSRISVERGALDSIRDVLTEVQFDAACSTEIGRNCKNTDRFVLRRIQIEEEDSLIHFKAKIHGAYDWVRMMQRLSTELTKILHRFGASWDP